MTTETEGQVAAGGPAEAAADGAAGSSQAELASADALSYEQARAELVEVVQRLESGGSTLEESLALWERGEELAGICRAWLEGARARLDAVLEEEEEEEEEEAEEAEEDER
ncbi:exodeoxyribonuclease VII small subunit [Streptomyces qinglanensis]|uniref:Exodeoxyribonuclease 7 small subunit n=1 Tax=Streptomyces qinglanensis TaxID=943816 RepID=A0A1H9UW22_9ACTN|nr:exodeoxyribonuclease VII small subunit [Streptomyces qinglanensis]SES13558.1 exodeoxyribonuclease VII small subunit [Streptomyces qinglanensis]